MDTKQPILEVKSMKKYFPIKKGFLKQTVGYVKAVDDVSFQMYEGENLGLVGESGCGKTTLGRAILRAIEPTDGEVLFKTKSGNVVDVTRLDNRKLRAIRRDVQMIFQDPYSSLNPRMTVLNIVGEPLICNNIMKGEPLKDRVRELMETVGLDSRHLERYPHAFSGGQRQRIGIARALATNPRLIVCDEAVSALDVSVQGQIINLLQDLQERFGLSYIFISHDLGVIQHVSDRVGVMYVGKMVELAETERLFGKPKHPYTEALLSARPIPDPRKKAAPILLKGEVANPAKPPSGCYFHPRCRYATELCKKEAPEFQEVEPGHFAACHHAKELDLQGAAEI
ncbi:ABC transporter ATP-binding protein [Paenibacillus thermotolerans]|uniref:ABC transporter ATP-binding protein n=1 Tax=Paenibacillus thermotolerans TaxID=3027807 RepID=UPI0023675656|nr:MULTISPECIES: ABC transporter ATP-binding protein [unclassified Paenibacillus]